MRTPIITPPVERGIPLPPRLVPDERNKPRSPWMAYLRALVPGDSFVVPCSTGFHVMNIGKGMGIPLCKRYLATRSDSGLINVRVWLDATDPDYSI